MTYSLIVCLFKFRFPQFGLITVSVLCNFMLPLRVFKLKHESVVYTFWASGRTFPMSELLMASPNSNCPPLKSQMIEVKVQIPVLIL